MRFIILFFKPISLSDANSIYLLAFSYLYFYLMTCQVDWIFEEIDH